MKYILIFFIFMAGTLNAQNMEKATFGAGCFWCVETLFDQLNGVSSVSSGYMGGAVKNPSYREVCNGTTGHAEVIQIVFNSEIISFKELLEVFWKVHDPTTLNRQGNDRGTQYRSAIFYHSEDQKEASIFYKKKLEEERVYNNPIVTEITKASEYYIAEDYHQNYYELNKDANPYCSAVISPKVEKFKKAFSHKLK